MGEARLELLLADLLVAGAAFLTMTAARDKGHGDPIAHSEAFHIAADGGDGAGKFMARHVGKANVGIMAHPAVPVAAAEALALTSITTPPGVGIGSGSVRISGVAPKAS